MKNFSFKNFKWLYLWIAAAALVVFATVLFLNSEFGNNIVFYVTGVLLIIFVIIRFIPLIKTTREKWAIVINSIEMFVDLVVGVLMIVLTAKVEDPTELYMFYPFLVGGILYVRGAVYFTEIAFFKTKVEIPQFFINIALITAGAVIIGRFDDFSVDSMRYLIGVIFAISGIVCTVDGFINFNNYRNEKTGKAAESKKDIKIEEKVELPANDTEIIIDENIEQPQDYVN